MPQTETLRLALGKEYNLNNVKEISVTKDFMGLGEDIIECQNDESYDDCTTREYTNDLLTECKCLPFNTGQKEKVKDIEIKIKNYLKIFRTSVSLKSKLSA